MLALLAPGQGSQTPGFLAPWLEDAKAAELIGNWSQVIGIDLKRLGTVADADEIRDTANAQPLLVAGGLIGALRLFGEKLLNVSYVAGHSVGEITASVFAGALDQVSAMKLVHTRGAQMAIAANGSNTGMSAVGAIATAVTTGAKALKPIVKKAVDKRIERVAQGKANPIIKPGSKLSGLKDKVVTALNKVKSGTDTEKKTPISISGSVGDTNVDFSTGQPTDIPFFTKYKTPLLIGGGLVGAFLLYKVFKK